MTTAEDIARVTGDIDRAEAIINKVISRSTNQGATHGQQVEARRGQVATGHGEGASGSVVDLVAGSRIAASGDEGERGGHQRHGHRASAPAAATACPGAAPSRGPVSASPDVTGTLPASGDVVIVIPVALVEFAWTASKGVALALGFALLAFFAVAVGVAMGGVR